MVSAVVFDMGGVLIRFEHPVLIREAGITDPEGIKLLTEEVLNSVEWVRTDRGTLTREEALENMKKRLPERLHEPASFLVNRWHENLHPMEGMAELIREIKALGYPIYLLSNAGTNQKDYWPKIPGSECFDGRVVSAEVGLLKPQPEIYQLLYRKYRLLPERCFFIDDYASNLEGALLTDMPGFIFRGDVTKLRAALIEAGVSVRPRGEEVAPA